MTETDRTADPALAFTLPVDTDLDLVLREQWTVAPLHRLIVANQHRLQQWEPWAVGEQRIEALQDFTKQMLQAWLDGANLPIAIRLSGQLVGVLGARIDVPHANAEIGYWVDAAHEGRGIVVRSCRRLVEYLFDRGTARIEIRTGAMNTRGRALAERLGFTHEGTLRSAVAIGEQRQDVVVYGLLRGDT